MRKYLIFRATFILILLLVPAETATIASRSGLSKHTSLKLEKEDVESSYTYLYDGDNNDHKYGARFYITNNTGTARNVHWSFEKHENVKSSTGSYSGDESLIGYGQVLIVTLTQDDRSRDWSFVGPALSW